MNSGEKPNVDEPQVVSFAPHHGAAFKALNEAWITQYFALEAADRKVLDAPETAIIAKGGHILMAVSGSEPVGTCALLKVSADCFELAKMAVTPRFQGRGVGRQLGLAAIALAKAQGARRLCLESNTRLKSALALYRRLGFQERTSPGSAYCRCDIYMELDLV